MIVLVPSLVDDRSTALGKEPPLGNSNSEGPVAAHDAMEKCFRCFGEANAGEPTTDGAIPTEKPLLADDGEQCVEGIGFGIATHPMNEMIGEVNAGHMAT